MKFIRNAIQSMKSKNPPVFIDVFAGCGGLSLGLLQSGWSGLFAVERDKNAFETLNHNLIHGERLNRFQWPTWLPVEPLSVTDLLEQYDDRLRGLKGQVDMLVGGPPCQGFSSAGKRNPADPRNTLVEAYLELVKTIEPKLVLIENVRGINSNFSQDIDGKAPINYARRIIERLEKQYHVATELVDVSRFGVPQKRHRFFILALRKDLTNEAFEPFSQLEAYRQTFLRQKGIYSVPVSTRMAISDLEVGRNGTAPSRESSGFSEIKYSGPITSYQAMMRGDSPIGITNTRLANHRQNIQERFKQFIELCHSEGRLNTSLSPEIKAAYGLKKSAIRVLDPDRPSPTITSMPDDLIHYSEPRTLTVRENARIQSFPDYFDFKGKYTTGGERRKAEVPRFTQVANAVPPLMAEALGCVLAEIISETTTISETSPQTNLEIPKGRIAVLA